MKHLPETNFPARFFDGITPIPLLGRVYFLDSKIHFHSENDEFDFSLAGFHQLEIQEGSAKLTISRDERKESPVLEIQMDRKEAKELRSTWKKHQIQKTRLQSFIHWLEESHPLIRISLAAFVILSAAGVYYSVMNYSYVFFPRSVDYELEKIYAPGFAKNFTECKDLNLTNLLNQTVEEIKPVDSPINYKVTILKTPVENAYAFPGGQIYVFSGLLEASDSLDEIQGVLAHEIAHIQRRHHLRKIIKTLGITYLVSMVIGPGVGDWDVVETATEIGTSIAILKYSRDFEAEADKTGIAYLHNSGYSVRGLKTFFLKMDSEDTQEADKTAESMEKDSKEKQNDNYKILIKLLEYASTHPATENRISELDNALKAEGNGSFQSAHVVPDWDTIKFNCSQ